MSKKGFVALADFLKNWNEREWMKQRFTPDQIEGLAKFLGNQNPRFNRERWLRYVTGDNGPNGGDVLKVPKVTKVVSQ